MKTVKGNPNTHYISSTEWDLSYMLKKPIIDKLSEGDVVVITRGADSTAYTVVVQKSLKEI